MQFAGNWQIYPFQIDDFSDGQKLTKIVNYLV